MLLYINPTFFFKFHMVCTFQPPKIWWQTSVQAWSTLVCCHFEYKSICEIRIIFAINQFETMQSLHLLKRERDTEREREREKVFLSFINFPLNYSCFLTLSPQGIWFKVKFSTEFSLKWLGLKISQSHWYCFIWSNSGIQIDPTHTFSTIRGTA